MEKSRGPMLNEAPKNVSDVWHIQITLRVD